MSERAARLLALLVIAAGCSEPGERPAAADDVPVPAAPAVPDPAPVDSAARPPLADTALVATVRRGQGRRYSISGETRAAGSLELTLEDGHRVLFGPTPVEVDEGHFHLEFTAEPSDRAGATVFITSPDGARQWVIAVPPDSQQVRFGPS